MRVDVVLLRRMKNLGSAGALCAVRLGYANYLLRERFALRATKANIDFFENEKERFLQKDEDLLAKARLVEKSLEGKTLKVIRSAGNTGKLYGSVSAKDLADLLLAEGVEGLTSSMIILRKLIKSTGVHNFEVQLHPDVDVQLSVIVARTEGEAADFKKAMTAGAGSSKESPTESGVEKKSASEKSESEKAVALDSSPESVSDGKNDAPAEAKADDGASSDDVTTAEALGAPFCFYVFSDASVLGGRR